MEQGILEAILAQLQTIRVANGYHTDIGLNVTYFDLYPAEYKGPARVTFRDGEDEPERVNRGYEIILPIEVEAIAFTTSENRLADGCNLLADLVKNLIHDESWYPDGVITITRKKREKDFDSAGKQAVKVLLGIEILYQENI